MSIKTSKNLFLVDGIHPQEMRYAMLSSSSEDSNTTSNRLEYLYFDNVLQQQNKFNIYLAKVIKVEPSLQAAFVYYGPGKHGFLPFSEIHSDYYQEDTVKTKANKANLSRDTFYDRESNSESTDLWGGVEYSSFTSSTQLKKKNKNPTENIRNVIRPNQLVQVQLLKDERGTKGAYLTTYISIFGYYMVLMPMVNHKVDARRVDNKTKIKSLIDAMDEISAKDKMTVILGPAARNASKEDLLSEYKYLKDKWKKTKDLTSTADIPSVLHKEGGRGVKNFIRDYKKPAPLEIVVDGTEAYEHMKSTIKSMSPSINSKKIKIRLHKSKKSIFSHYSVEEQISNLFLQSVPIPSGGYIVINTTEALVAIDINSGSSTSQRNVEDTAFVTNLDATKEIARQLRLRDLSGLIVIDFIDMYDAQHRKAVEQAMKEALADDKAKIYVGKISPLGLLELSRQRLHLSFWENNSTTCDHCDGTGWVRSLESKSLMILRKIDYTLRKESCESLTVYTSWKVSAHLLNSHRLDINVLEKSYKLNIYIYGSDNLEGEEFKIVKNAQDSPAAPVMSMSSLSIINNNAEIKKENKPSKKEAKTGFLKGLLDFIVK